MPYRAFAGKSNEFRFGFCGNSVTASNVDLRIPCSSPLPKAREKAAATIQMFSC
jgi:hypothetical protein